MKIVILSDTHGSLIYIQKVVQQLDELNPDIVIHLGDDYADTTHFLNKSYKLLRVPGTWSSFYQDPSIPNRTLEELNGWTFCLSHTPETHYNDLDCDLDPKIVIEDGLCDIFLHGHTHIPSLTKKNNVIVLNPGHLKINDDRGFPPTYAIIESSAFQLDISIRYLLEDTLFLTSTVQKKESSLTLTCDLK